MTWVTGLILAAGSGQRMGRPKAEIVLEGTRLVDRAVAAMGVCDDVLVVVRDGVVVPAVRTVVNAQPERGLRSSLRLGIQHATEADALAVMLVDLPGVRAEDVTAVVRGWRPGRIALGSYGGRRAHPIVMGPGDWVAALDLAGPDEGARRYLAAHPDRVDEVDLAGDATDLDRPEDLARWQARTP